MTRDRFIRLAAASIAIPVMLAASPSFSQEIRKDKEREVEKKETKAAAAQDPLKVFKGIEKAWQKKNADGIASYASEGQVFLDVRGIGRKGGYYSRSQVKYLFMDMFKADDQLKFEFVKFHNLEEPDRKVYGIAYRSCKNNRSGKVFQDKVYVTLGREGPAWVVAEIKTTR
jgi:ketosteroid isomerase-like protein